MKYIIILLVFANTAKAQYSVSFVQKKANIVDTFYKKTGVLDSIYQKFDGIYYNAGPLDSEKEFPMGNIIGLTSTIGTYTNSKPVHILLPMNFSSVSSTPAIVTGWSFAVTAGTTYRIEIIAVYQTAATTTGGIIGVSLTGATGTIRGKASGAISQSAAATELAIPIRTTSGSGSTLTTTGVSVINSPHFVSLLVTFTCIGTGTFNIVWGTEIAASAAQINAGSSLIYQAL